MPARAHGMSGTLTYYVWMQMRQRCNNPRNRSYHNYGARGIRVCARWQSFELFLQDMGEAPRGMTLERINRDLWYEPGNCCWASRRAQANNMRRNVVVAHEGRTSTLAEWAREKGLSYNALRFRYAIGERPPRLFRPVAERAKPRRRVECGVLA